ncbi:MAG: ATP-binding cassette domain-containing protein, partial [Armatimonadetes bacterium]|nr:ATP-binding cassette domain-containing protein [Armatimonadota bacterium]
MEDQPQTAKTQQQVQQQVKVQTRNLSVFYGRQVGIRDINIEVFSGEVLACIGPSGCGKSTFLRCLNRMNDEVPGARVEGTVLLEGQDIYAPGVDLAELRRRVGMV